MNNVSKGNAKVVLKLNKIGQGSDFEEKEFSISQKDVATAVEVFKYLNVSNSVMQSFQKRRNFQYQGVEIALKYSEVWRYHVEFEIVVDNLSKRTDAERQIRSVADELGVTLMSDEELREFTSRKETEHLERQNNLSKRL